MKKLFAPWRIGYILGKKEKGCVFCRMAGENKDKENFILRRGKTVFSVLNLYPYNNGHLMVVPYRHVADLSLLTEEERKELMEEAGRCAEKLKETMRTDGFNIGMNIGRAAGAGIADHLHFHVVPRWVGDENFMTTVGDVKVIPEGLQDVYKKLK